MALAKAAHEVEPGEAPSAIAAAFKPKRGRPSASQVAAIDAAIIAAARTLFLENGYANTAMEAVAASVGVSKGTLYSRYPSKPDLFKAIVAERLSAWSVETPDVAARVEGDLSERMFRTGVQFLMTLRVPEVAAFDRLIMSEAGRFPELFREFNDQGYVPYTERLTINIVGAERSQTWPMQDARSVATCFLAALHGWYRVAGLLDDPTEDDVARYVARLVAVLVGGRAAW